MMDWKAECESKFICKCSVKREIETGSTEKSDSQRRVKEMRIVKETEDKKCVMKERKRERKMAPE